MNDVRRQEGTDWARRIERRAERAKRGLVVSYLHELSDRHGRSRDQGAEVPAVEPSRAG